ncbi:D-glycero-D-manno-heptose 1-phosphate guanosyltransferase [Paenibacillus psychroresistens]|uniref:D-glycero-D-manno-heptose 1-phosphate guanosyltransferase n=1 Tax=Paenibacillus psychroresistens TaxID=1778678 RepID=A0A6B8RT43_9BACL|nr:nucleotidyltransferase family protein [Paenibacillus psychroresistens]QGQ98486.1 D-glycero-D-manno-heptose 1-phosphate guanosyltransferase [Paenibacillus psychroresistens]
MEAIILAGGLGSRLRSVVADVPKPMAPINNQPFLKYLMDYLDKEGITKVILSTGYKHEVIEACFGSRYKDIEIVYSIEDQPLGTGGAIKKALDKVTSENVFILNGDTFFNVNLQQLLEKHLELNSLLTFSLKPMTQFDRYGIVKTNADRIVAFTEKMYCESGNINGGVYVAQSSLFNQLDLPDKFSFETDYMVRYVEELNFNALISDKYFIDIGIPEDYSKAQSELEQQL